VKASPAVGPAPKPRRILVIDDDPAVLETTVDILRTGGHSVSKASGGAAGLGLLAEGEFDLVVTDLGMPEMTGWDVARAIRDRRLSVPVIVLTGWGETTREVPDSRLVDRVLGKPVEYAELLAVVQEVAAGPPAQVDPPE
jgi:CheY-like chemotaxis protein